VVFSGSFGFLHQ